MPDPAAENPVAGYQIVVETDALRRKMIALERKQLPFATALALTAMAVSAASHVRFLLPSQFKLRSTWVQKGIRITPANKRDWPNTRAVVGSRDPFMVLQETGGVKKPLHSRELALPGKKEEDALRGAGGRIPKGRRPRALLRKRRYFFQNIQDVQSGNRGLRAILQRAGPARYPLRVIYVFKPRGKISPRFGFQDTVTLDVRAKSAAKFDTALEYALRHP